MPKNEIRKIKGGHTKLSEKSENFHGAKTRIWEKPRGLQGTH